MDSLVLESERPYVVHVRPSVLFSVLDLHMRRSSRLRRVVGALLGRVSGNEVHVTSVVPARHREDGDRVRIMRKFETHMELHRLAHPGESVVGWYSSVPEGQEELVSFFTLAMHRYKWNAEPPHVHLAVDATLASDSIGARAFVALSNEAALEPRISVMQEVRVLLAAEPAERTALDAMVRGERVEGSAKTAIGTASRLSPARSHLLRSMRRLYAMLAAVSDHVARVTEGKAPPDPVVGRAIANAVAAVPIIRPEDFGRVFTDALQDLLAVGYLSTLTEAQLALAERMAKALPF